MPIRVRCTDCATQYNLADTLAGKKIRCKKCQGIIAVPDAENGEATTPAPRNVEVTRGKTRPSPVREEQDEPRVKRRRDEEYDEPRTGKKALPLGWIIGGSVGVVLLIGGIILAVVLTRGSDKGKDEGQWESTAAKLNEEDVRQAVKDFVLLAPGYYKIKKPEVTLLSELTEPSELYISNNAHKGRNVVACYVLIRREAATEEEKGAGFTELAVVGRDSGLLDPKTKGKPVVHAMFGEMFLATKHLGEEWLSKHPFPKRTEQQ